MAYLFQQALNALQLGSIYALIALGYTMVYGILTMINFAHGDLFMVGAFFCFLLAVYLKLSFVPTLLVSMLGVACLGVVIERLAYKPLRAAPRVSAIITALVTEVAGLSDRVATLENLLAAQGVLSPDAVDHHVLTEQEQAARRARHAALTDRVFYVLQEEVDALKGQLGS